MHDPTEHVQEHIQHTAAHGDHNEHGGGHGHASQWITAAALSAAILAAFAAVSGNLATTHLTQSTHKRIDANDKWSYYQSKSLKNYLLQAENDIVEASVPAENLSPKVKAKLAANNKKYAENEDVKTETANEAKALEKKSSEHLETHETYELSATMFHISIAIVAIAVVAKRRTFWYVSLVAGVIGLFFFGKAYIHAPAVEPEVAEAAEVAPAEHAKSAGAHDTKAAAGEHEAKPAHADHEGKAALTTHEAATAPAAEHAPAPAEHE